MAANDYKILCAGLNAYIGKESKRNKGYMCEDRREIPEKEILLLIDWWLNKTCSENGPGMEFNSVYRSGKKVVLGFVERT